MGIAFDCCTCMWRQAVNYFSCAEQCGLVSIQAVTAGSNSQETGKSKNKQTRTLNFE